MKRVFVFLLAAALLLSLAACGGGIENMPERADGVLEEIFSAQRELLTAAVQLLRPLLARPLAAWRLALDCLGLGKIEKRLAFTMLAVPVYFIQWYAAIRG